MVRTMSCQVAPSAASSLVMLSKVRRSWARKSPTWTVRPASSMLAVPEISRMVETVQIDTHAARKGASVVVGFVQRCVIGDRPLHDRGCGDFCE